MSKHSASGKEWEKFRQLVFRVHGRVCVRCGNYANTVDHLDPVSLGGDVIPSIDRAVPMCTSCNSIKGNKVRKRCTYVNKEWLQAI
jgi:5-methylcytosine-specific restriction endonuclease McrA